jgi:hypothetical protein
MVLQWQYHFTADKCIEVSNWGVTISQQVGFLFYFLLFRTLNVSHNIIKHSNVIKIRKLLIDESTKMFLMENTISKNKSASILQSVSQEQNSSAPPPNLSQNLL